MSLHLSLWEEFATAFLPLVLAALMQTHWSGRTKRAIAVAASALLTVAGLYFKGDLNWSDPISLFFMIFLGSQGMYHLLNKNGWLNKLSSSTDLGNPSYITKDELDAELAAIHAKLTTPPSPPAPPAAPTA